MAISVAIETPLQDDVRSLVNDLNDHLLPLSPIEFQFKMTVEQMAGDDTTVLVARDETGHAVGCGALKAHGDGVGEVKRMFTRPTVRGQRVGSALLDAITNLAKDKGITRLVLETGTGPVLDYPDSEHSAFYEKRLALTAAQ
jgi:putative acetyltransferase